mmetsp:Transcript_14394/g.48787  ORF Transcript_14394/g.48787 Transcript_14394/m.48787 type:complete len:215 (-) Transcript_14394:59-703(-)
MDARFPARRHGRGRGGRRGRRGRRERSGSAAGHGDQAGLQGQAGVRPRGRGLKQGDRRRDHRLGAPRCPQGPSAVAVGVADSRGDGAGWGEPPMPRQLRRWPRALQGLRRRRRRLAALGRGGNHGPAARPRGRQAPLPSDCRPRSLHAPAPRRGMKSAAPGAGQALARTGWGIDRDRPDWLSGLLSQAHVGIARQNRAWPPSRIPAWPCASLSG